MPTKRPRRSKATATKTAAANASGAPGAPASARARKKKSQGKPSSKDEHALQRARGLRDRMKPHVKALQKNEKKGKGTKKLLPNSALVDFNGAIRATSTAMTAHKLAIGKTGAARRKTDAQRAVVLDRVKEFRELVGAAFPDDADLGRAYAVGERLSAGVTQDVLAAAARQQQSFESPELGPQAREAGLTKADFAKLITERRGLEKMAGDLAASERIQAAAFAKKEALVRDLNKSTTHTEKIVRVLARKHPDLLAQIVAPRRRGHRGPAKTPGGDGKGGAPGASGPGAAANAP